MVVTQEQAAEKILVAVDVSNPVRAIDTVKTLSPYGCGFKIGRELVDTTFALMADPEVPRGEAIDTLDSLRDLFALLGRREFMDMKPHDISNTVAAALLGFERLNAKFINYDVSGVSMKTLIAAHGAKGQSLDLGVTVLTDMDKDDVKEVFNRDTAIEEVEVLVKRAVRAHLDGVVCSPQELSLFKQPELSGLIKVTPSIRPLWAVANDQARPTTPGDAILAGADYEVIGRPLTAPPESYTFADGSVIQIGSPEKAIELVIKEIQEAMVA